MSRIMATDTFIVLALRKRYLSREFAKGKITKKQMRALAGEVANYYGIGLHDDLYEVASDIARDMGFPRRVDTNKKKGNQ